MLAFPCNARHNCLVGEYGGYSFVVCFFLWLKASRKNNLLVLELFLLYSKPEFLRVDHSMALKWLNICFVQFAFSSSKIATMMCLTGAANKLWASHFCYILYRVY